MKDFVVVLVILAMFAGAIAVTLETPVCDIFDVYKVETQSGPLPFEPTDTLREASQKSVDYIRDMMAWAMDVYETELGAVRPGGAR